MTFRHVLSLAALAACAFADDPKPTKATARAADGLSLVYEDRGRGDTALVFLHGWCGDRDWWKHQVGEFAGDYRVVAPDQAGHGESGKDRKEWTLASLAADVESLAKSLGLKRVILVGHSMGGSVALAAAKRMPGTVVGVVGVDTLHNAEFQWPEEQRKAFLDGFAKDFPGTLRGAFRGMFPPATDPELVNGILAGAEKQDRTMAVALMRDLSRADLKTLLKEAQVPVRCVNSAGGFQFARPTAVDVNRKYADFQAVLIEGVGHWPMVEKPREFNAKLRDVLKEFKAKG